MRRLKVELWPHKAPRIVNDSETDIHQWLEENVGLFRSRWNAIYGMIQNDYYFVDERDMMLFILRWT